MMEKLSNIEKNLLQLIKVSLSGRPQDVQVLLHRMTRGKHEFSSDLLASLNELFKNVPTRSSPLRKTPENAVPVDLDSRFQLLKIEDPPILDIEPSYSQHVDAELLGLIKERRNVSKLNELDLDPTRTALFTGPPGVGKTLAARWVARELGRPLLILDLSSVMSSYLGRTGTNLRHVLEYAKSTECVLLLDELDAIAKRRDDLGEIGELKRLVTVLIQQLDEWPASGVLLAATNHPDLLDPAIWRRFEMVLDFPLPSQDEVAHFVQRLLEKYMEDAEQWAIVLSFIFHGMSYSDIQRVVKSSRRASAVSGKDLSEYLLKAVDISNCSKKDRIDIAVRLVSSGLVSQRGSHEITGVARETIRRRLKPDQV